MDHDDQIAELFGRWKLALQSGRPQTPEELCAECPETLPAFRDALPHLAAVDALFDDKTDVSQAVVNIPVEADGYHSLSFHKEGGLGVVLVGEERELRRTVAIKCLKSRAASDPQASDRFFQEAEVTAKLDHPGVVPIYRKGRDTQGMPYYAMRFVQGETLGEAIARFHSSTQTESERNVERRRLLRAIIAVCETIAFAHSRGVVHRDIKPDNIILGPFGETLVLDWGLAKRFGTTSKLVDLKTSAETETAIVGAAGDVTNTLEGSIKGSPAFMSPEQARGDVQGIGPATDIYSLGSTLYVLLTGKPPYSGKTVYEIVEQVRTGQHPTPLQVTPSLEKPLNAICDKAMSLDPKQRYADPRELARDLDSWLADEPVTVWSEPVTVRIRRWMKRHRTLVATGATGVMLSLLAAIGFGYQEHLNSQRERQAKEELAAAYDELQATHEALRASNDELKSANNQVKQNFGQARDAVRELVNYATLGSDFIRPGAVGSRQEMLRAAKERYQYLIENAQGEELQVAVEMAFTQYTIASVSVLKGALADAEAEYRSVAQILKPFLTNDADAVEVAALYGDAIFQIGILEYQQTSSETSLQDLEEGLKRLREITEQTSGNLRHRVNYIVACSVAAYCFGEVGDRSKAQPLIETAQRDLDQITLQELQAQPAIIRSKVVQALTQAAAVQLRAGRLENVASRLKRAAELVQPLIVEEPANGFYQFQVLEIELIGIEFEMNTGQRTLAQTVERCFALRKDLLKLADVNPESAAFNPLIARTFYLEGMVQQMSGKPAEAVPLLKQARDSFSKIHKLNPKSFIALEEVGSSEQHLALTLLQIDKRAEAETVIRDSRRHFEDFKRLNPQQSNYFVHLCLLDVIEGMILQRRNEKAALVRFERARNAAEAALQTDPTNVEYQNALANALLGIGTCQAEKNDLRISEKAFEQSLNQFNRLIHARPHDPRFLAGQRKVSVLLATCRSLLAEELWKQGKHEPALKLLDQAATTMQLHVNHSEKVPALDTVYSFYIRASSEVLFEASKQALAQKEFVNALELSEKALPLWEKRLELPPEGPSPLDPLGATASLRKQGLLLRHEELKRGYAVACLERQKLLNLTDKTERHRARKILEAGQSALRYIVLPQEQDSKLRSEIKQALDALPRDE